MGFSKGTVLIGRTGSDTIPSIPDPTLNRENRLKRALGAPPMTDKSRYSESWQAGGALAAVQSFRAVGAAAAAQRARGHCDSAFYFGWGYETLTQES